MGKIDTSHMTILESVGFSQSSQAGQGAKSKWICIFKRKKQRGGRRTPLLTGCFAPVWSVGRQKSSVLCQAPVGPQEQGWEHVVWAQRMRLTSTETSYNTSNLSSSRGDFYYRGMLVLKKDFPRGFLLMPEQSPAFADTLPGHHWVESW